ncbi:MAG TPA: hypothetical protein VN108_08100 [Marmoricola sp.]|nr:hypothetical protein [Marmoricola sp.]
MADLEEHAGRVEGLSGPDRLDALERQLYELVPPIDPPALYWLDGDATYSYCWPCARKARWHEMGNVGEPPFEADWWAHDPIEDNIRSGIDGGFDGSGSDCPESCELCGCTLRHTLTEYGVSAELDHFAKNPGFSSLTGEDTYTISRICLNLTGSGADEREVTEATKIVEDALEVARTQGNPNG